MKKPAGLVLIASLLFLVGLWTLSTESDAAFSVKSIQLVIGALSIVAAYGLWTGRNYAMKAYWLWVASWLIGGGLVQILGGNSPMSHVVIWWVFVGTVWLFVGIYLKGALRQTA